MLPPDTIVRAASRWIRLLRGSTSNQAASIIRAGSSYTDLTQTQYASGLELLRTLRMIEDEHAGVRLSATIRELPEPETNLLLFESILTLAAPAWLRDADLLVPDPAEVPTDAAALAVTLDLSEASAFTSVRQVHGRIDLAQRALIGSAGELALVQLLEQRWPGSTTHVAQTDDGFGYDVLFRHGSARWHLEVKTTTRRGRLVIYLSRHEHEVSLHDPYWRLVVVGLDNELRLQALATVRDSVLSKRAPLDLNSDSKWQSASHQLTSKDLSAGFSFLDDPLLCDGVVGKQFIPNGGVHLPYRFTWMPNDGVPDQC